MASRTDWAKAFRDQAESDFRVYRLLSEPGKRVSFGFSPEKCHLMHYLQMALEKIFKAYKLRDPRGGSVQKILSGHVVVGKLLVALINSPHIRMDSGMNKGVLRSLSPRFNQIAREMEKMAPGVDRSKRPENAEYPWESGGGILTPCRYDFPNTDLTDPSVMGPFLKMVDLLIRDFDRISL